VIAWCLLAAAALVAERAACDDAARLLGSAEAIVDEVSTQIGPSERRLRDTTMATLEAAGATRHIEDGRKMDREEAMALAHRYLD
jgi:hypothetical protein